MSPLKSALLEIQEVSEQDYQLCYKLLHDMFLEHVDFVGNSLGELASELEDNHQIEIKQLGGIDVIYKGKEQYLFTYPSYGWDGGNPIDTRVFNLIAVDSNDFGSGPISTTAIMKNINYPALVLYNSSDLAEIHIFQ